MPENHLLLKKSSASLSVHPDEVRRTPSASLYTVKAVCILPSQSNAGTVMTFNSFINQKYTIMNTETNNPSSENELTKEVASLFESLKHVNEDGVVLLSMLAISLSL